MTSTKKPPVTVQRGQNRGMFGFVLARASRGPRPLRYRFVPARSRLRESSVVPKPEEHPPSWR
jgi:hypothetical protein